MDKELLDSEFYKKKEIPARDWWENRRSLFNKFCLASIASLFLITILIYLNKDSGFFSAIVFCVIFSLIYFTICNLAYSGIWISEDIVRKLLNLTITESNRIIFFRVVIILLFLPSILSLFLNIFLIFIK